MLPRRRTEQVIPLHSAARMTGKPHRFRTPWPKLFPRAWAVALMLTTATVATAALAACGPPPDGPRTPGTPEMSQERSASSEMQPLATLPNLWPDTVRRTPAANRRAATPETRDPHVVNGPVASPGPDG